MKGLVTEKKKKPKPTSPEKWARAKAKARSKFDVYPSAYANAYASKEYKKMGGGWRMGESIVDLDENMLSTYADMFDLDEGWKEDTQELEDWSKEVNKKLYQAHESQRPALARQLSKVEQKNFGSTLNQGGLTELVHAALRALQKGQMLHYDPQRVGQTAFGNMVGDDARIMAASNISRDELYAYRILRDKGIVDNIEQFLKLRREVHSKTWPQAYLDQFEDQPEELWLQFVKDLGWSKDDMNEEVQAKTDDKLLAYYAQRKAEKEKQQGVAEGVRDLGYDAQSLIMKLRRDVEEKRLQPTPQAVLAAARELAGDMEFAPQLLVKQVLGQGVAEAQGDTLHDPEYALPEARRITKAIKYDDTVGEIITQIQMLAERTEGIDSKTLEYSIDGVLAAKNALESAVYGLEEAFEDAARDAQYKRDEVDEGNYHDNRTGFKRGPRDDERHDLDVQQPSKQVWGLKINGKVWSKDGKDVTFASKEQALKARQSLLAKRPELEVGLVTKVSEDYTGMFAAEKTPKTNPYGGSKDRQFRGAISETPTDNPTGSSGEGGWRTYRAKPAGQIDEEEQLDELKCWTGYTRVKGVPAGAVGSCKKKTKESSIMKGINRESK